MLFDLQGTIKPEDFRQVIKPLGCLLAEHGIVEMTSISISFLGWRTDGRAQIVDASGFIKSLGIDGEKILNSVQTFPSYYLRA